MCRIKLASIYAVMYVRVKQDRQRGRDFVCSVHTKHSTFLQCSTVIKFQNTAKLIGKFGAATVTEKIFNERNLLNGYTIEILLSTPGAQSILQLCGKLF